MLPMGTPMSFLHGVANLSFVSKFLSVCLCISHFVFKIKGALPSSSCSIRLRILSSYLNRTEQVTIKFQISLRGIATNDQNMLLFLAY